uniref:Uncharacterized protein n=1 Tax=Anopheles atroparvus TaxID=41427 RepID=A0A182JMS8_ANOAO
MKQLGIINFIVVPIEPGTLKTLTVWTSNQFTNRVEYFRSDDRSVVQLFPDKLHNLNGYEFTVHGQSDYPYMVKIDDATFGVVPKFIDNVIRQRCNGTTYYTHDLYRYDLIGMTFFGGGGIEYEQPFPFRIVMFTLTVLVFFLSEAYNTKIISLMSFSKFFVQPQTLEEFIQSDMRILHVSFSSDMLNALKHKFLSYAQTQREERRLGIRVHEIYCSILNQGAAWIIVAIGLENHH